MSESEAVPRDLLLSVLVLGLVLACFEAAGITASDLVVGFAGAIGAILAPVGQLLVAVVTIASDSWKTLA